jgi:hypothetical protein
MYFHILMIPPASTPCTETLGTIPRVCDEGDLCRRRAVLDVSQVRDLPCVPLPSSTSTNTSIPQFMLCSALPSMYTTLCSATCTPHSGTPENFATYGFVDGNVPHRTWWWTAPSVPAPEAAPTATNTKDSALAYKHAFNLRVAKVGGFKCSQ